MDWVEQKKAKRRIEYFLNHNGNLKQEINKLQEQIDALTNTMNLNNLEINKIRELLNGPTQPEPEEVQDEEGEE